MASNGEPEPEPALDLSKVRFRPRNLNAFLDRDVPKPSDTLFAGELTSSSEESSESETESEAENENESSDQEFEDPSTQLDPDLFVSQKSNKGKNKEKEKTHPVGKKPRLVWTKAMTTMVEKALEGFRGKFKQIPPLFSALKMNGKRL
ncbi:hypothetical protein OQA88_13272 [Cercophora sp. LCS_1]